LAIRGVATWWGEKGQNRKKRKGKEWKEKRRKVKRNAGDENEVNIVKDLSMQKAFAQIWTR